MFQEWLKQYDFNFQLPIFGKKTQNVNGEICLKEKGRQVETQLLDFYGVKDHITSHDVICSKAEDINNIKSQNLIHKQLNKKYSDKYDNSVQIHTLSTHKKDYNENLPDLVFLHGYWSSSLSFVKMVIPLKEHFNIHLIDLPGQALSSRTPFQMENNEQIIDFYVENLESWRQQMFKDKKVYLAGHSFGGFLAGHYAMKYEENLSQLFLISPFGIWDDKNAVSFNESVIYYTFQDFSTPLRNASYYLFQKFWNVKVAVSDLYQGFSYLGNLLLNNFLKQTLDHKSKEYNLFFNYYDTIMRMPVGSERCMTSLLKFPQFTAINPLEDKIQKLDIPVHFFYGDKDWMEKDCAKKLIDDKKIKNGTYTIIKEAGHNVQFEQADNLAEKMITFGGFE